MVGMRTILNHSQGYIGLNSYLITMSRSVYAKKPHKHSAPLVLTNACGFAVADHPWAWPKAPIGNPFHTRA